MTKNHIDEILMAYDVMKFPFKYNAVAQSYMMSCDMKCKQCSFLELRRHSNKTCYDFSVMLYEYFIKNQLHSEWWV